MSVDPAALSKIVRESGVEFRENATSYVFTCPRCMKKDRLAMYKDSGFFVCYHCRADGFKGRPEFALTELLGLSLGEIRKKIYGGDVPPIMGYLDVQLNDIWGEDEDSIFALEQEIKVPEVLWPPDYVGLEEPKLFVKGARYLHSRGITAEHVNTYDIRYSTIDQRVVFPVKVDGKLVGWQARYIGATERFDEELQRVIRVPKIITSDSLVGKGQRWLMFQDRLKGSEHCVLAEGPISAIKAHKCGGNVASMGKAVTAAQLDTIRKHVRKLYLALDPDAGEQIMKLVRDNYSDMEVYVMVPPQNHSWLDDPQNEKDLGDLSADEVHEVFLRTQPEPFGKIYISLGGVLAH